MWFGVVHFTSLITRIFFPWPIHFIFPLGVNFLNGHHWPTAATMAGTLSIARSAHAAGSDMMKIALIGCGGRGSGAVGHCFKASKGVKLVAMADMFTDRLEVRP